MSKWYRTTSNRMAIENDMEANVHFDRNHWFIESKPPQMMRPHSMWPKTNVMCLNNIKWWCFVHSLSWSNVNNTNICHLGKNDWPNVSCRATRWTEEKRKKNHPNRTSNVHGESCQKRNLIHTVTAIRKPIATVFKLHFSLSLVPWLFINCSNSICDKIRQHQHTIHIPGNSLMMSSKEPPKMSFMFVEQNRDAHTISRE